MAILTDKKYSFVTNAPGLGEDTFAVVRFTGYEGISRPYEFDITLVSENGEVDLGVVLANPARMVIHREDGRDVTYHGILREFEQQHEFQGYVFYRAVLAPRLWWLTLTHHNQVCLGETIPEVVENTLKDGGLASFDFDFRLQAAYSKLDYVCQYGESHFDFVSRWLEREGIYYFFDQSGTTEKVVFTDTKISHTGLPLERDLFYAPPSGLDTGRRTEIIQSLTCRQRQLPRRVLLKDYNYEKPSLEIAGSADVDESGRGETYIYGEHFPTPEEGNRLARIRAEELLCHKREFFGESTVPFMMPGFIFTLNDHYRADFNRDYLIEEVTHEGSQTGFLIAGVAQGLSEHERTVYYRNSFKAITSDVQYRPERKTQKPRVHGTINARVDAEGSGRFAELDTQGRYKVRLPFDINGGHGSGKASSFVRMAQPYAGSDHGMHFPLHKGTEVLLTFVDGDPDRPIIAGAIPNPETPSVVNSANNASGGFTDGANNFIMHNSDAGQRITMTAGPEGGAAFFSMGTGSPSGKMSQSDYEAQNSYYYTNAGLFQASVGSLSQNMTAQSILWAFIRLLSKHICDTIIEHDKIGKKTGSIEEEDHYAGLEDWHMAVLSAAPLVLSMILTSQMSFSMARHLLKKAKVLPMANFGMKAMELHLKLMTNSGWLARIREATTAGILGTLSNALTGWSGTYGAILFNNTNSMIGGFLHPTSGSGLKLNPRKPDILISSGYGYVDINAAKDVTLSSGDDIVLEGKNVLIEAPEKVMIGGGSVAKATLALEPAGLTGSSATLESGFTKIVVSGSITQPQIVITATRAPAIPIKQSIILDDISSFMGNNTIGGYIQADQIGVMVSAKTGNVQLAGMMGSFQTTTTLALSGDVSTSIGSGKTVQVNIQGQMLTMNGKFVKIGDGTGILQAQATMIKLG